MLCGVFSDLATEQLEGFGVASKDIKRAITTKILLTSSQIQLDNDHPPAEALGYTLTHIRPYLDESAWKVVTTAGMFGQFVQCSKVLPFM